MNAPGACCTRANRASERQRGRLRTVGAEFQTGLLCGAQCGYDLRPGNDPAVHTAQVRLLVCWVEPSSRVL